MPFCPKCRSEYVESIGTCMDCGLQLVSGLPEERGEQAEALSSAQEPWTAVGRFDSEWKAGIVRGALESEGIPCEIVSHFKGLFVALGAVTGAEIMVPSSMADKARELIQTLEASEGSEQY